jgi:NAD(P)-dependent dehydrogenase (short-subunit alcohol dehydrogenase family)
MRGRIFLAARRAAGERSPPYNPIAARAKRFRRAARPVKTGGKAREDCMTNPFDFSGKTVFVAGGSSGINLGIADAFAAAGARLAICSRSQERVDKACAELARHGGKVLGKSADVRDFAAISGALAAAHEALGEIDVLVSGAAGNFPAAALGMSANAFKTVIDIDLLGTFNVMRAAHQYLKKPGASIISISAPQSFNPMPLQVHACAAKAGVDQVTRVLAMEWGADGIRINSIAPGPIEGTEGFKRLSTPEARKSMEKRIPAQRFGTLADCANLALFLASPLASWITGTLIPVDGGWSLYGGGLSSTQLSLEQAGR